jgi:undecaprenyl-diphosphatase
MNTIHAIIVGIIQGITEFLPVSSSAHTYFFRQLSDLPLSDKSFDIFLNIGSLLAIFVFYRSHIRELLLGGIDFLKGRTTPNRRFFVIILLASFPIIVIFGVAEIFFAIDAVDPIILAVSTIIFALILWFCDMRPHHNTRFSRRDCILVGIAQLASILPGVSRLSACLSVFRYLEYTREDSFRYSMLLSIPPVAGAIFLKLIKVIFVTKLPMNWIHVAAGSVTAFVFGLGSLAVVSNYLRRHTWVPIILYRIAFGVFVACFYFFH